MKAPMHYVNDADGNVQAVQVPVKEWNLPTGQAGALMA